MKVKENLSTYTHRRSNKTTIVKLISLEDNSGVQHKFKFSYDAYNAGESFTGEIFTDKLNHVFNITDLGFTPDSSMYVCDEEKIKSRFETLNKKGLEFIKNLY